MTPQPLRALALSLSIVALAACQSSAEPTVTADPPGATPKKNANDAKPAKAEQQGAAKDKRTAYGDPLTGTPPRVALADLVKNPNAYADKVVTTEGKVTAVCQGKGCWLELGEDGGSAHVKLGGHKFFVPRESSGRRATVEAKVLPSVDKGHCEQEAEEQTGRVAKVELVATGVELF